MEQQVPMPGPSPEMGSYQRPEAPSFSPEHTPRPNIEAAPEKNEQHEIGKQPSSQPVVVPVSQAAPSLPAPAPQAVTAPTASPPSAQSGPMLAKDSDLIEKEWVDKAKQIVQQTRDDPYAQEQEMTKLQADYIKKRYGKEVKLPK